MINYGKPCLGRSIVRAASLAMTATTALVAVPAFAWEPSKPVAETGR